MNFIDLALAKGGALESLANDISSDVIEAAIQQIMADMQTTGKELHEVIASTIMEVITKEGPKTAKTVLIEGLMDAMKAKLGKEEVQKFIMNAAREYKPKKAYLLDALQKQGIFEKLLEPGGFISSLQEAVKDKPELQKLVSEAITSMKEPKMKGKDIKEEFVETLVRVFNKEAATPGSTKTSQLFEELITTVLNVSKTHKIEDRDVEWITSTVASVVKAKKAYKKTKVKKDPDLNLPKKMSLSEIAFGFFKSIFGTHEERQKWLETVIENKLRKVEIPGLTDEGQKGKFINNMLKEVFYTGQPQEGKAARAIMSAVIAELTGWSNADFIINFIGRFFYDIKVQEQPAVEAQIKEQNFNTNNALPGAVAARAVEV